MLDRSIGLLRHARDAGQRRPAFRRPALSPHGATPMRSAARALACLTLTLTLTGCTHAQHPAAPKNSGTTTAASRSPQAVELPGNSWPAELAMAPDGTLWVTETSIGFLASISPGGRITQHRLADAIHAPSLDPSYLSIASDGSVWFTCPLNVGRLTPDGKVSLFGKPPIVYGSPGPITAGTDGSIWYAGADFKASQLVHITASLSATHVSVPMAKATPNMTGLAFGPGGRLWFTQSPLSNDPGEVGYADSSGHTKVWSADTTFLGSIVPGPDGALWFAETNAIGRITPSGTISYYRTAKMKYIGSIIAGPEHALWFTTSTSLGRITTAGVITLWPLHGAQELTDLVYDPRHHGFLIADAKAAVLRWFPMPA